MAEQITFVSVNRLRMFVESEARKIERRGNFTLRNIRQLTDAQKFLELLKEPSYADIQTVSELKQRIADERRMLQEASESLTRYMPGYQMSLFEEDEGMTEKELNEIRAKKCMIDNRIKWLHKCLGICHNKEYFR